MAGGGDDKVEQVEEMGEPSEAFEEEKGDEGLEEKKGDEGGEIAVKDAATEDFGTV